MSVAASTATCLLCPQHCQLKPGQTGICRVRRNVEGEVRPLNYGQAATWHLDPIEKKPLFHFYPGSWIFSVAGYGCNLRCSFCQNYEISQSREEGVRVTPAELAAKAMAANSIGLCFTYTEPTTWFEMIRDTAPHVREQGGKVVLVSNGVIAPHFLEELIPVVDAANIDIKAFTDKSYRKYCAGRLEWVLGTVERLAGRIHLEVTTLIVPGANDSPDELKGLAVWLQGLGVPVPWHLSRYHPAYKLQLPPTEIHALARLWQQARGMLPYVYMGNVDGGQTTFCPRCGEGVVVREYYVVRNRLQDGQCPNCGEKIFGVGM